MNKNKLEIHIKNYNFNYSKNFMSIKESKLQKRVNKIQTR